MPVYKPTNCVLSPGAPGEYTPSCDIEIYADQSVDSLENVAPTPTELRQISVRLKGTATGNLTTIPVQWDEFTRDPGETSVDFVCFPPGGGGTKTQTDYPT